MTLLLIPGFMLDDALWDDMLPFLSAHDVRFAALGGGATIEAMAQAVLAHAPSTFVLLGFSMGGYVAREIARLAPARVTALVLVATSSRPDQPDMVRQRVAAARQAAATTTFHGLSRGAIRASLHPGRHGDAAMIERVRAMGERLGRDAFLRQSAVVRSGDAATLDRIHCPTLVIGADGDQLRSVDEMRELAAGIPGAELAIVAGSGHMIPLEAPQQLGQLVTRWLAKAGAGAAR